MNAWVIVSTAVVALLGHPRSSPSAAPMDLSRGGDTCVVRIREAGTSDVLIRDRNPLLGAPENANDAPGPGSLRAVVRGNTARGPAIFILDTSTDQSRFLCSGSTPRVSPDGRWLACSHWLSRERPYVLAVAEVSTGHLRMLETVGQIEDYAWSPDSKRLAFTSSPYDSGWRCNIGWVDIRSANVHVLASDTQSYVEYGDCEWAPDSRRFLVNRHREYEDDESLTASDLWLFDVEGRPCRLTHTPDREKESAGWIDGRRIRYDEWGPLDTDVHIPHPRVIELSRP